MFSDPSDASNPSPPLNQARAARRAVLAALLAFAALFGPGCQDPMPEGGFLISPRPPETQPAPATQSGQSRKTAATQPEVIVVPSTMPSEPPLVLEEQLPLSEGDTLEVAYYKEYSYEGAYRLEAGDKVKLEVDNRPELSHEGAVLPDGTLTLPLAGTVAAGGKTAAEVQAALTEIYGKQLKNPKVSVLVLQTRSRLADFFTQLQLSGSGTSRETRVTEGMIDLQVIGPVSVVGKTLAQARAAIQAECTRRLPGLHATIALKNRREGTIAVMGEVNRAGVFPRPGPTTLMQALASAGGLTDRAWTDQVLIVRRQRDDKIWVRVVNLSKSLATTGTRGWGAELAVNDTVYVPRSPISDVNLFVDQYLRQVLPFQVGAAATYPIVK